MNDFITKALNNQNPNTDFTDCDKWADITYDYNRAQIRELSDFKIHELTYLLTLISNEVIRKLSIYKEQE